MITGGATITPIDARRRGYPRPCTGLHPSRIAPAPGASPCPTSPRLDRRTLSRTTHAELGRGEGPSPFGTTRPGTRLCPHASPCHLCPRASLCDFALVPALPICLVQPLPTLPSSQPLPILPSYSPCRTLPSCQPCRLCPRASLVALPSCQPPPPPTFVLRPRRAGHPIASASTAAMNSVNPEVHAS